MTVINPFDFFLDEDARTWPFRYDAELARDLAPYLEAEQPGPLLSEWMAQVPREEAATIDFLVALNQAVLRDVVYSVPMEHGVQTPEETWVEVAHRRRDGEYPRTLDLRR